MRKEEKEMRKEKRRVTVISGQIDYFLFTISSFLYF